MQLPLVSILIPFKNTAEYLPECLNSILSQKYERWEVLAIDDNSSDSSAKIVKLFSKTDPRIQLHPNPGNGIIEALRKAYSLSKGTLISRMDSDDIMLPEKLDILVNSLLKAGKGHLATGQVEYFSARGIGDGYARYELWLNKLTAKGHNFREIYKECVIPSPCWMLFREDLDACGAFDHNRYPEDYDLTFRFYTIGLKVISCSDTLHLWRDYDSRTSRTSEHYAQNYFLDIKLYYFLKLDYDPKRPLALWGAGTKGKNIANALITKGIAFKWLCDNPKKIGKEIYGVPLEHFQQLTQLQNPQSLITVANEKAQKQIHLFFTNLKQAHMIDYFFFC